MRGDTVEEWIDWYEEKYPDARKKASDKIEDMIGKLANAMEKIDREMIERWVKDLVLYKTFIGLHFQEAILKRVAKEKETSYRTATAEEESRGIDEYIDDQSVSIKPVTYKTKAQLSEEIAAEVIYYEKKKGGITIQYDS